jgi:hypothetical protein
MAYPDGPGIFSDYSAQTHGEGSLKKEPFHNEIKQITCRLSVVLDMIMSVKAVLSKSCLNPSDSVRFRC